MARRYDQFDGQVNVLAMPRIGTFSGTIAAAATLSTFKIPPGVNGEIVGYTLVLPVGGTAASAGPGVTFNRSLAGTGTATALGTLTLVGTNADMKTYSGTMTTTGTFVSGDEIRVRSVAGTAALTFTEVDLAVTWVEKYAGG